MWLLWANVIFNWIVAYILGKVLLLWYIQFHVAHSLLRRWFINERDGVYVHYSLSDVWHSASAVYDSPSVVYDSPSAVYDLPSAVCWDSLSATNSVGVICAARSAAWSGLMRHRNLLTRELKSWSEVCYGLDPRQRLISTYRGFL